MIYNNRSKVFIALAVMGIAVSIYHAYDEITYTFNSCTLNEVLSCKGVFSSGYTQVLGIDFWIYGVVWFPFLLIVCLWVIRKYGAPMGFLMAPLLMVGNIFTIYPWYIEITLLGGRYCLVCIVLYIFNYLMTPVALLSRSPPPAPDDDDEP